VRKKNPTYKNIGIYAACLLQGLCYIIPHSAAANNVDTFGIYIAPNAIIYANNSATVSVFSNMINSGILGSVKGSTIRMFGNHWRNTPGALFPDEWGINNPDAFTGVGGAFRFESSFTQFLAGGYSVSAKTGGDFPNLIIANPRSVYLDENTDTHVRGTLVLENGLLWLNGNNLLIGSKNPGAIAGYSESRFIATGNTNAGGYLYRAKVSGKLGSVVFPIGTQTGSYAPVSVMFNTDTAQDLHVRVFDILYNNATIGRTGNPTGVQQTWNIGQEDTLKVPAIVAIQHMVYNEGPSFTAHRGNSYISMYDFTKRAWDYQDPSTITNPGTFTTGTPIAAAYLNARIFTSLGQNTYLTKFTDIRTDSITLAKAALNPVRQPDGSFKLIYLFMVRNTGVLTVNTLHVIDSLSKVFTSPTTYSVVSVTATGNLVPNKSFDGETNTDLLMPSSTLTGPKTDTVTLVLNVITNKKDGYYYNTAAIQGILNGYNGTQYVFNNQSVNGMTPPAPATPTVPTPALLSASKYQMPEGFSPNGDGINDKLIIGSLGNNNAAIWIFDKQGAMVYRNMNYHNDWDGTYFNNNSGQSSGKKVEDGTYFYKVVVTETATGNQETYYGYLSIWR
jgi:gliding motility-associated-like protein